MNLTAATVQSALDGAAQKLHRAGVENARMEAVWILSAVLNEPNSAQLLVRRRESLSPESLADFEKRILEREKGIPLAYILGSQDFMGLDFAVAPAVLIPRPETEILVEECLRRLAFVSAPEVLDIGTGSGNIACCLAARSRAAVTALDVSKDALALAEKNARRHGVAEKIRFLEADLFPDPGSRFDLIVSNPPYIASGELKSLQREISFEPPAALDGGKDGLEKIRRIAAVSPEFLKAQGWLCLEVGYGQSGEVRDLMRQAGFKTVDTVKDSGGIDRVLLGEKIGHG